MTKNPQLHYATVAELKEHLNTHYDDTGLFTNLITLSCTEINEHCGRWFVTIPQTRRYDLLDNRESFVGKLLLVDADLYSLTSLVNGDGSTINPDNVILRPVNWPPYFGIALKRSSALQWVGSDPIIVTGQWGYSESVPQPIHRATLELAAYRFQQYLDDVYVLGESKPLPRLVLDLIGCYIKVRIDI